MKGENGLRWITCPHCGTTFRVGVPPNSMMVVSTYSTLYGYEHPSETCCPKCTRQFYIYHRKENE